MKEESHSLLRLVRVSLWISLTVVFGFFVKLKTPLGIFTPMCDVGIYLGATLFGKKSGLAIGSLSGGLLDLIYGEPIWIIPSMIIHGSQGLLVGHLTENKQQLEKIIFPYVGGGLVMLIGYLIADVFIYGVTAVYVRIFTNGFQTVLGILIALVLKVVIQRFIKQGVSNYE